MQQRSKIATALRSFNALTGALLGFAAAAAFIFAGLITEGSIGRPSPTQMAYTIIFALPYMGVLFAVPGALLGWIVHLILKRTALAGCEYGRLVVAGFALIAVVAGFAGFNAVHRSEARNKPAVFQSNGTVTRLVGSSPLTPLTPATLLYDRLNDYSDSTKNLLKDKYNYNASKVGVLKWRNRKVEVEIKDDILKISQGAEVVDQVNLKKLDYVREIQGVTVTLEEGEHEWLALLVRLRATGRRELFLIYDFNGVLAHKEILSRTRSGTPVPVLWSAGKSGDVQELILNLGEPLRYIVQR